MARTTFPKVELQIAALAEERARGDAFERVIAHFLRHDPSLGMRRVWTWRDWPGRRAAGVGPVDLGIDLVAEDDRGELVGVQVKHRLDPHSHLRWSDISTALGFRPDLFARRLIVTNAADRTANARKATVMTENTTWAMREDLLASPIDWSHALEAQSGWATPIRVKRKPRSYQATAVADVIGSLANNDRAQLVMACGSGKTLVTLWVAEGRGDERILVLVPTLLLLKQFRREWREAAAVPFIDLAVCSDADTVEPDEWQVRADELGVPVTTDPLAIAAFVRGPGRRIVFATYASSARVADAQEEEGVPAFHLVVADEAHRIAGVVNTGVTRERDQRVVLDSTRIRSGRRLFATATPRVYGQIARARLDRLEDVEVASMDDETLFGPVAHRLWFRAAVELGILSDYQLIAVLVTDSEVADLVRERAGVVIDGKVLDAETLATLIAVRRTIDELKLTRAISFHHTIARAKSFARALSQAKFSTPAPDAEYISGAMSVDERERVLHTLAEPKRPTILTNARCLTEGIDVPSLDAIAFVDPRSSAVDIVQAVGRVMRRAPSKDRGYVLVPVFLREESLADPQAAVESTAFAKVLDVLRALRAHDPELTSDATRIKASLGQRDAVVGGHIADHVRLLGVGVDVHRFERALELRFVEVASERFAVGLSWLRSYVTVTGQALVPARFTTRGGYPLGSWVNSRRMDFRSGLLSRERIAQLEAIPGWSWSAHDEAFVQGLAVLTQYVSESQSARVPADFVTTQGYRLGRWAIKQRALKRRGLLETERATALEAFPGWDWDPDAAEYRRGIQALKDFVAARGNSRVPRDYVDRSGTQLGNWVGQRRMEFRKGSLSIERRLELEAIHGWSWDTRRDAFDLGLAALGRFVETHGSAKPLTRAEIDDSGFALGHWVNAQRAAFRSGRLLSSRISALERVPGWRWDPFQTEWLAAFEAVGKYIDRTGHARVPQLHIEGAIKTGAWVARQRAEYKRGHLDSNRIALLEALPGWVWRVRRPKRLAAPGGE